MNSHLTVGQILDGYRLLRFLGRGGFGEVRLCRSQTTGPCLGDISLLGEDAAVIILHERTQEIRFEVGRLEEVLRWVLSFGSHAKVVAPPELAKMVRAEVRAMQVG